MFAHSNLKKLLFLNLGLLASAVTCFSQTKQSSPAIIDVFPKSPDVAALGKYGDVPVGLYTGVSSLSIPVWQVKLKNLSIPISIAYHSSGIKVNEISSSIGLGWALQAGGNVSCNVNGLPDIGTTGNNGANLGFTAVGWPNTGDKTPQTGPIVTEWSSLDPGWSLTNSYFFAKGASEVKFDTQPDLFSINYNGQEIKFFFDQDKQIHLVPYKRIKINMSSQGFTLIDENDNTFEFFMPEVNETHSNTYDPESISTLTIDRSLTHHLTRIITAAGEVVNFNYVSNSYQIDNQKTETRFAQNDVSGCFLQLPSPRIGYSKTYIHAAQSYIFNSFFYRR